MNRSFTILFAFLCVSASVAGEKKKGILFTVTNPTPVARITETVSISLEGMYLHDPSWKQEQVSVFQGKKELLSQTIDLDQDGIDDEVIFQTSFKPNETIQFELYRTSATVRSSSVVDVRYVLPREDVGWENDRIAFRVYGSVLAGNVDNGIDVWTKRVRYPIVAKWYAESEGSPPGKDTYHQDRGEGADFFSVGKTLGAGSGGILRNGKLIQPGLFSHYRIVTNGPIRVSFELYYTNVRIDTVRYSLVKRITLDAGEQLNRIDETYLSNAKDSVLMLAVGLVKRSNTTIRRNEENSILSLWGATTSDSVNGNLGTGIVLSSALTAVFRDDSLQYLTIAPFIKGMRTTYYSGAAWSRMGDIGTAEQWFEYLKDFHYRRQHPLIVRYK